MRKWTDEMLARLPDLVESGFTQAQIADAINEEFGTSFTRSAVASPMARLGLKTEVAERRTASVEAIPQTGGNEHRYLGRGCQYIYGDPKQGHRFCDEPRVTGKPYCEMHTQLCYVSNRENTGAPFVMGRHLEAAE